MSNVKKRSRKSLKTGKLGKQKRRESQVNSCSLSIFSLLRNGSEFDPFSSCFPGKVSNKSPSSIVTHR